MEVEGAHTYFVRAQGSAAEPVWVHNTCLGPWNRVGGHHPISKAAMRDAPGYLYASGELQAARTNAQLVEEIATRAKAWGVREGLTGTPREIGTAEHVYAKKVLDRYQRMFGDRGLVTERSFLGGVEVPYGTAGSARLDVFDVNTGAVWDYRFGTTPMSAAQRLKIMTQGPGVTSITPVMRP